LTHDDDTAKIELYYIETNVKEYKCVKCINYTDLIFQSQMAEFEVSSYFKAINEWYKLENKNNNF
jgi:hypothetical protein